MTRQDDIPRELLTCHFCRKPLAEGAAAPEPATQSEVKGKTMKHVVNGDQQNGWYCYSCDFTSRDVAEAAAHDGTKTAEQPPVSASPTEPPPSICPTCGDEMGEGGATLEDIKNWTTPAASPVAQLEKEKICTIAVDVENQGQANAQNAETISAQTTTGSTKKIPIEASPVAVDCSGGPRCPKCGSGISWEVGDKFAVCNLAQHTAKGTSFHQFEIKSVSDFVQFFRPVAAHAPKVDAPQHGRLLDAIAGPIATYESGDHADRPCGNCAICTAEKILPEVEGVAVAPQVEDDHNPLTMLTWSRSRRENG